MASVGKTAERHTPTSSSWLNQVELWFAKIELDVIARGVFTSVPDLKRKLMRYIRQYNKQPKPVKWKKALGWIEGQNLVVEGAFADFKYERLPALAENLVPKRVDVVWATTAEAAVAAAR